MAIFAILMIVFLIIALFILLAQAIGPLPAAFAFVGFFFALIVLTYILVVISRRPPSKRADDRLQRDIASIAGVTALSNAPLLFGMVRKRKSLLLIPVIGGAGLAIWRSIATYRRRH